MSNAREKDTEEIGQLTVYLATAFSLIDIMSPSALKWPIVSSKAPSGIPESPALNLCTSRKNGLSELKEERDKMVAVSFIKNGLIKECVLFPLL